MEIVQNIVKVLDRVQKFKFKILNIIEIMEKVFQYYFINENVIKIEYNNHIRKNYLDNIFEDVPFDIIKMVSKKELINIPKINFNCLLGDIGFNKITLSKFLFNKSYHPKSYFQIRELDNDKSYLLKPSSESGGRGIKIIKNIDEIPENHFIQEIIEPDLIDNKKYDLRIYLLIINYNNKNYYYLSKDGKIRLSSDDYDITNFNSVIINSSRIQEDSNIFHQQLKLSSKIDFDYNQIKNITEDILSMIIIKNTNTFNLYGLDFMKDNKGDYYLLEINNLPNFYHKNDSIDITDIKNKIKFQISDILENIICDADNELLFWQLLSPKISV